MSWLKKGTRQLAEKEEATKWDCIEKWSQELTESEKQKLLKTLPDVKKSSN